MPPLSFAKETLERDKGKNWDGRKEQRWDQETGAMMEITTQTGQRKEGDTHVAETRRVSP